MLSKARSNLPNATGDLSTDEVAAFPNWTVFTQKKEGAIHLHAGSLGAPNADFAQMFAREHYGQDQPCSSLWIGPREIFTANDGVQETYEVFVQWVAGGRHEHVGVVEAENGADAKTKCVGQFIGDKEYHTIWSAPNSILTKIDSATDMIWRETTDQNYRLAKGYSRVVRQKWDAIRAGAAVDKYQEEDLKDTF
jgi:ring-1,2-phenylacetyl-CoA epoxidase subunit PaaB